MSKTAAVVAPKVKVKTKVAPVAVKTKVKSKAKEPEKKVVPRLKKGEKLTDLSYKEEKVVLMVQKGGAKGTTVKDIAKECFPTVRVEKEHTISHRSGETETVSYNKQDRTALNSLRRPVALDYVRKIGRGLYAPGKRTKPTDPAPKAKVKTIEKAAPKKKAVTAMPKVKKPAVGGVKVKAKVKPVAATKKKFVPPAKASATVEKTPASAPPLAPAKVKVKPAVAATA